MNKLVLSAFMLAAASQAAGCIIVSGDDDTGAIDVTWSTVTLDANRNPIAAACPAGATSATVYALPEGSQVAESFKDYFDCGDNAGGATDLAPGNYIVWVELTDTNMTGRYAQSASQLIQVTEGDTTSVPNFQIFVDHGYYSVKWTLNGNGSQVQCAQVVGGGDVAIDVTDSGGSNTLWDHQVPCTAGVTEEADSAPVPLGGQYTISVELLNQDDISIGTAPTITPAQAGTLQYGNEYKRLGTVQIALE